VARLTGIQKRLLQEYTRAIVHMRKRFVDSKLSLVFGAGISKDCGIPEWTKLIDNLAKDKQVRGEKLLKKNKSRPITSRTQVLFHHYAAKRFTGKRGQQLSDGEVKNEWRNIVRKHLYKNGKTIDDVKNNHPYLTSFLKIVMRSPITVNYNFDDYIEQILQSESTTGRIYETIWDPQLQTKFNNCVIYHPNGFLPKHKMERQSEGLVFCEDEFADQLIESMAGRYAALLHHYSQKTCLFLGLSLEDSTLKHLLRQSSTLNPGHYHYYVAFQNSNHGLSTKEKKAIFDANFNLYNLITLFFTAEEINELGNLLTIQEDQFISNASIETINLSYCYYIVGSIGAGKSTMISHFRNLTTHDEWPDFRISELGKDWKKLGKRQKQKVDNWIASQFCKKNKTLQDAVQGIHIIDRAPLDPIAFTEPSERASKAQFLFDNICGTQDSLSVKSGHVIFLYGDPKVMEERAKSSGKEYDTNQLEEMQKTLKNVYKSESVA